MGIIMLALLLAAIIITINAIHRGAKRKQEEADKTADDDAFVDSLLRKRRELDEMEKRVDEYRARLAAEPEDHDKETPRKVARVR